MTQPDNHGRWLAALFVLLLHLPLAARLLGVDAPDASRENRVLARWPELPGRAADVVSWPQRFQRYYDDTFGLRNVLTYLYSSALYHGLSVMPFGKVRVAQDGWVFENVPDQGNCRKQALTPAALTAAAAAYHAKRAAVEASGSKYLLVLVPGKASVYRPDQPQRSCPHAETTQGSLVPLLRARDPGFPVLDLFGALVLQKQHERVYFLDDPHWNDSGAFVGYREIVRALAASYPGFVPHARHEFREVERTHLPGAYSRFANVDLGESTDVFLVPRFMPKARKVAPPGPLNTAMFRYEMRDVTFEQDDRALPRALVFRDSFFEQLRPLVAEHFSRISYIWHGFEPERVRAERPDLVIEEKVY